MNTRQKRDMPRRVAAVWGVIQPVEERTALLIAAAAGVPLSTAKWAIKWLKARGYIEVVSPERCRYQIYRIK